ncbi:hypothetical protein OG568_37045 [Streptomyces sp. NBC_01450]|uniref:hypothetical protein n=1 Tax=Streptomyces sp. NBC_01450 TaxID=2903871 RepID=UPI002E303302|nr:hypothetical protein [Streptomyces sp. NBC_01450]
MKSSRRSHSHERAKLLRGNQLVKLLEHLTMSPSFAIFLLPLVLLVGTLWLACAVLGVHGLLLGRMPGKWLQRHVRQPRLWGAGAPLVACGGFKHPSLVVVGIGLIALGHAVKPTS